MGSNIDVASTGQLVNRLLNPPNPMEQLGQTTNALMAVRNFQAQQAAAQAYTQAVDPTTGQLDMGKFNKLLAQSPTSAWNLGAQMQQSGQGVQAQGQGTSANVKANLDQLDAIGRLTEPLYQQAIAKHEVNPADAQAAVDQAYQMKLITPQQYQAYSATLKNGDSKAAANWVIGASTGLQANRELAIGHPQMLDVGPGYQPVQTVPGASQPAAPYVPKAAGPEGVTLTVGTQSIQNVPANVAQAITQNPELLKTFYPQQYAQMHPGDQVSVAPGGRSGASAPAAAGTQPGAAVTNRDFGTPAPGAPTPVVSPPTGGATPPAPGGGGAAPIPQPPATPERITVPPAATAPLWSQPPGPLPAEAGGVGMTPQTGYVENVQQPSQKAATALVTAANDTPNVVGLINDMRSQVNQPGWSPGLGAQAGSTWRQFLDKVGVSATGSPMAAKDAQASYDEFSKDANLIASRQLATIGNPSDARQGLAEAITPGMAQTKEGVLGISATLAGNQHALAQTAAGWAQAKQQGWPDGRYNEWLNQRWNVADPATGGRFDPRVFWLADTEGNRADQIRRFASKIPQDQQGQFLKNVQYAKNQGWVKQNDDGSYVVSGP